MASVPQDDPNLADPSQCVSEESIAEAKQLVLRTLRPESAMAAKLYDDWAKMEYWTDIEAAVLGIGMNPLLDAIQFMEGNDAAEFHKLLELIRRKFGDRVRPDALLDWSREMGIGVHEDVLKAISNRKKSPRLRPQDEDRRENTADKMLLAMVVAKYKYRCGKSENAVAQSIKDDFDKLDTGQTLAPNTILARLRKAAEENPALQEAIKRRK